MHKSIKLGNPKSNEMACETAHSTKSKEQFLYTDFYAIMQILFF